MLNSFMDVIDVFTLKTVKIFFKGTLIFIFKNKKSFYIF